jgi:endonuclease III
MKDATEYALRLKKFHSQIKREIDIAPKEDMVDPTTALVLACLSMVTTQSKARAAMNKIRNHFVDLNELRVSRVEEITDLLGKGLQQAKEIAHNIIVLLQEVYDKCDTLDLTSLQEGNKRDAKAFLTELDSSTPYIVAYVMLHSIGAHAFPVHPQMLTMLRREEVIDPEATASQVQGFLERQFTASDVRKTYAVLRRYADSAQFKCATQKTPKTKKTPTCEEEILTEPDTTETEKTIEPETENRPA